LSPAEVEAGLGAFSGVRRRQEVRGQVRGITVIDDFAHHPTAVRETLAGLRGVHGGGRLVAVLEPRSATSKRRVFQQAFADALAVADEAVIAPLHAPEKVPEAERLDIDALLRTLQDGGTAASCIDGVAAMVDHLAATCGEGDTVVVMSSGGFEGLPDRLVEALNG
jgi:UDP-N-acetylmuramate: L-alanyl-gamma-D-glutamyl-meso-diaminopimelate ligase